jgi:hypothetical protein
MTPSDYDAGEWDDEVTEMQIQISTKHYESDIGIVTLEDIDVAYPANLEHIADVTHMCQGIKAVLEREGSDLGTAVTLIVRIPGQLYQ